jgi:hypothetical protein
MKGKLITWSLVIIACFVIVGVVLACPPTPRPPEPTCPLPSNPDATITVTPAQWVDETTTCPVNQTFTASRQVVDVPAHWGLWGETHNGDCPHGSGQACEDWYTGSGHNKVYYHHHRTWIPDTYRTETFTVTFDYGKSQDPNHCHRPTGRSLGVPSWAMDDFNHQFPEIINVTVVPGYWIDPVCQVPAPRIEWGHQEGCGGWQVQLYINGNLVADTGAGWQGEESVSITFPGFEWAGQSPVIDNPNLNPDTCTVPPELCTDEDATNTGEPLPCVYEMCQYDPAIRADDPLCVPPVGPCEFNPEILADDPACVPPEPPEYVCQPNEFIWVWDIEGPNGMWYHLRDLGYDGTYDAPSLIQQRYYLGCDFYPVRVWGHYVSDCDVEFNYWSQLPAGNCGGQCPLP